MTTSEEYYGLTDSMQTNRVGDNKSEIYREAVRVGLRSRHFYQLYIFGLLIIYCTVFYYFGELIALFQWDALKLDFFYGSHNIQRACFLVPIIFAACAFKIRGAILAFLISSMIILTRFLLNSSSPEPLVNIIVFIVVAAIAGFMAVSICNRSTSQQNLNSCLDNDK